MPKGPQGQWRPADPVGCAVHVRRIATGEIEETYAPPRRPDPAADSRRASKAAKARADSLSLNAAGRSRRPGQLLSGEGEDA